MCVCVCVYLRLCVCVCVCMHEFVRFLMFVFYRDYNIHKLKRTLSSSNKCGVFFCFRELYILRYLAA